MSRDCRNTRRKRKRGMLYATTQKNLAGARKKSAGKPKERGKAGRPPPDRQRQVTERELPFRAQRGEGAAAGIRPGQSDNVDQSWDGKKKSPTSRLVRRMGKTGQSRTRQRGKKRGRDPLGRVETPHFPARPFKRKEEGGRPWPSCRRPQRRNKDWGPRASGREKGASGDRSTSSNQGRKVQGGISETKTYVDKKRGFSRRGTAEMAIKGIERERRPVVS